MHHFGWVYSAENQVSSFIWLVSWCKWGKFHMFRFNFLAFELLLLVSWCKWGVNAQKFASSGSISWLSNFSFSGFWLQMSGQCSKFFISRLNFLAFQLQFCWFRDANEGINARSFTCTGSIFVLSNFNLLVSWCNEGVMLKGSQIFRFNILSILMEWGVEMLKGSHNSGPNFLFSCSNEVGYFYMRALLSWSRKK
jgi:hypothetical protein